MTPSCPAFPPPKSFAIAAPPKNSAKPQRRDFQRRVGCSKSLLLAWDARINLTRRLRTVCLRPNSTDDEPCTRCPPIPQPRPASDGRLSFPQATRFTIAALIIPNAKCKSRNEKKHETNRRRPDTPSAWHELMTRLVGASEHGAIESGKVWRDYRVKQHRPPQFRRAVVPESHGERVVFCGQIQPSKNFLTTCSVAARLARPQDCISGISFGHTAWQLPALPQF